ncbi:MAG: metal-dependent hydrolase [Nitrospirota bacterium]|nr:metal-dependent hydrolase [Nitrospirota bacterium]
MTPFGHLSVSYIPHKTFRNISLPALLIGGLSPDLDFLFIFFDWFNQVHRVVTHNLFFAALISLSGMFFAAKGRRRAVVSSLLLGMLLHLLADSCMDNNPTNGIGLALFWPLSGEFYSPFNLLHVSERSAGWRDPLRMFSSLMPVVVYEVPLYLLAGLIFFRSRKRQRHS